MKLLLPLLKTRNLFFLLFLSFSSLLQAQQVSVTIKVTNQKREPLPFSTINIGSRADSLQNFTKSADSTGKAIFNLQKGGQYTIKISAVTYLPIEKGIAISGNQTAFTYVLESGGKTMDAAVVVSKKPLMKQEDDKTIVDPENLIASSTSGFEVIEKTPGLFIDQDGNIYISSFTPASVQVNGRDLKMSAADVATMLKSFPPNAVAKIEIVRTPSASQDASGSGGIVNIVLKKGFKIGITGSVSAGMQQGTYGNQFIGFSLNNNDGKKSSYINANVARRNNYEIVNSSRIFATDTALHQLAFTKYPASAYFTSYGFTNDLSKKWALDFAGSVALNDFKNSSENNNLIQKISTHQQLSSNINSTRNDGSALTFSNGLSLKKKIDSLGSEWNNDIYYSWSKNNTSQDFSTNYYSPFIVTTGGNGVSNNKRGLLTLQSDLKLKLKKKVKLEAGLKSSILSFNSITNFNKIDINGNSSKDATRTSTFNYDENINAAYLQSSKTFGKDVVLKTGLRLENTNMIGKQIIPGDTSFSIHRTDLFPYVYLSKNLMKIAGYDLRAYLVYRRSISRPAYEQLNPFPKYVDQYLSDIGNPSLRPQFTQNYEANISVDERPIFAVGLNNTKDIFSQVTYQADTSAAIAYRTFDNLGRNKEWYFRGLGALPPGGRYFLVAGAQYNYNIYDGVYENKPLSFKKGTWTFFTYQTFKVDKKSVITFNGFIRFKGQQQLYEIGTFGMLNTSINRRFLKEKLVVTLSLNDIFFSNKINFSLNQGTVNASGLRYNDTRRFGLNLRYNFGIKKKEENNGMFNTESPANN
jgi:iron complex outermembrane recepter protein